jgi:hypothetical protein
MNSEGPVPEERAVAPYDPDMHALVKKEMPMHPRTCRKPPWT